MVSTDRRAADPVLPVLLGGVAALALLGRPFFELFVGSDHPGLQAWATVFVAIVFQAVPFLVLGTLLPR